MAARLGPQLRAGDQSQMVVDDGDKLVKGGPSAITDSEEQVRNFGGVRHAIGHPRQMAPSRSGINARGDSSVEFLSFDGAVHGFLMSGGTVTHLDVPFAGAVITNAPGAGNDRGDVAGFYTVNGREPAFRHHRHGNYEALEAPAVASSMLAIGINTPGGHRWPVHTI